MEAPPTLFQKYEFILDTSLCSTPPRHTIYYQVLEFDFWNMGEWFTQLYSHFVLAQAMPPLHGLEQWPLPWVFPVLKSSHELSTQQPERHFEVQVCPCHCFALHVTGHLSGEVRSSYCSYQTWHVLASAYLFISLLPLCLQSSPFPGMTSSPFTFWMVPHSAGGHG